MDRPAPDSNEAAAPDRLEAQPGPRKPPHSPVPPHPEEAQRKLHDLLESMWEQSKGMVVARLNVLEEAVRALDAHTTAASREKGIDAAHKLAGILGTFGLPQGTELAREIEVAMSADGPLDRAQAGHLRQVVEELAKLIAQRTLPTAR